MASLALIKPAITSTRNADTAPSQAIETAMCEVRRSLRMPGDTVGREVKVIANDVKDFRAHGARPIDEFLAPDARVKRFATIVARKPSSVDRSLHR
jgi:hypothetical protein